VACTRLELLTTDCSDYKFFPPAPRNTTIQPSSTITLAPHPLANTRCRLPLSVLCTARTSSCSVTSEHGLTAATMTHISIVGALLVSVSYVVFRILSHIVASHRQTAKALKLGCKEPPLEPALLPFGIDGVIAALRADKMKLFLEFMTDRYKAMGVNTCKPETGPVTPRPERWLPLLLLVIQH
jgi:hypothetical protein